MLFEILAKTNGAEGSFRRVGKEAEGAAASFDKLGKAAFGITAVFAAFAVNAAVKFESAMTRISTQAGVPIKDIKALGDAILGLSPKVGFNPDELATSLYHVESAFRTTGISASKAIGIVENASKLAKIGNADLETTTQAIIGVLASNIKGVKDAQDAAAQLNQLVGTGDTNLQTVAKSIATGILPTAATLGLSFKDVAAGLATLTDNVTPADQAARVLKTSLLTLIKPSAQQAAAFEQMGLSTLQLGEDFRKPNGLLVGVQDLKTHLDAVFPATQKTALTTDQLDKAQQSYYATLVAGGTNAKDATKESEKYRHSIENVSVATLRANTVARALGGSKTAGTFLTLIQEIDRLKSKYDDFGTSAQAATKFQQAWANQQKTAKQKLDELDASWHVFLVQVGNAILPDLKKVVDLLAKHPGIIKAAAAAVGLLAAAWVASKFASAFAVIGRLTTAILGIGTAATTAGREVAAAELAPAAGGVAGKGARVAEGVAAGGVAGKAAKGGRLAGAAREGGGLLGGLSLGTAVGGGLLTAGAVLVPSFLLANQLGKKQSVRDIPQIDKFIGAGPDFLENKIPGLASDENKQKLIDYANKIGGLDLKLKNFYGDAADTKAINKFQAALQNSTIDLQSSSKSLDLHSAKSFADQHAIISNQTALRTLAEDAVSAAKAYAHGTGVQSDYTKALQLSIPQIEANAEAVGFNKDQVDAYLRSIGLIPPEVSTNLDVTNYLGALNAVNNYLTALSQIPSVVRTELVQYINQIGTGTAQVVPGGTQGTIGGIYGAGAAGQIPGRAAGGITRGWTWVGERGKELINVGSTSRVLSHEDSMAATGGSGPLFTIGQQNIHNNVDAREVAQQVGASVRMALTAKGV